MKLKCEKCNYKFKGDYAKLAKACPYCGKEGYISVEDTGEEVTKNVDDMF
jgi:predicted Zn-ribbon and HTH transcriptional regulator